MYAKNLMIKILLVIGLVVPVLASAKAQMLANCPSPAQIEAIYACAKEKGVPASALPVAGPPSKQIKNEGAEESLTKEQKEIVRECYKAQGIDAPGHFQ